MKKKGKVNKTDVERTEGCLTRVHRKSYINHTVRRLTVTSNVQYLIHSTEYSVLVMLQPCLVVVV